MFQLIETMLAFSVIMLLLSFLIKSLTSVIKNHVDYYSHNLELEIRRLVNGYLDDINPQDRAQKMGFLAKINWRRLSDTYLTRPNMEWILQRMGVPKEKLTFLESRLEVHKANLRYAFETRTKNISLAVGLALCLLLNINALTIWKTLYNNEVIRGRYTTQEVLDKVDQQIARLEGTNNPKADAEQKVDKAALEKQVTAFKKEMKEFTEQVPFGMGRIWQLNGQKGQDGKPWLDWRTWFYEFFGSLLTGIMVSIGAPYWHDLMRALSALNPTKKTVKA